MAPVKRLLYSFPVKKLALPKLLKLNSPCTSPVLGPFVALISFRWPRIAWMPICTVCRRMTLLMSSFALPARPYYDCRLECDQWRRRNGEFVRLRCGRWSGPDERQRNSHFADGFEFLAGESRS